MPLDLHGLLRVHSIGRFVGKYGSGMRSMWCWMDLCGGRPEGISSGKTWVKRSMSEIAMGREGRGATDSPREGRVHSLKALNS